MSRRHYGSGKRLHMYVAAGLLAAGTAVVAPQSAHSITGGNDVTDTSMGYVAQISHSLGGFCTGTLISQQWVLSAAHCVGGENDARNFTIRLGASVRGGGQVYRGGEIFEYPGYVGAHNDVALLKLENPVYGVQPIRLAWPEQSWRWDGHQGGPFTKYDDGVIAGWGKNSTGWPSHLQFKGVSIYPVQYDRDNWPLIPVSGGPCGGDSGGPLMVTIDGQLYQVGVMKSQDCATSGSYSDVGQGVLHKWITETVQNHSR